MQRNMEAGTAVHLFPRVNIDNSRLRVWQSLAAMRQLGGNPFSLRRQTHGLSHRAALLIHEGKHGWAEISRAIETCPLSSMPKTESEFSADGSSIRESRIA
jgi:hypothetical protein